jgi:hypothetical protein
MKRTGTALAFAAGLLAGVAIATIHAAPASPEASPDLSKRKFNVFIDEVKQNFVFGDRFEKTYSRTVTLSNGKKRDIKLTPMVHEGMQVVKLDDSGFVSYMSLSGRSTNGDLMIEVQDEATRHHQLREQGWRLP